MPTVLYTLPVPSTALVKEPRFEQLLGRFCSLTYSYEIDENPDLILVERLVFEGVEAFQVTYYRAVWIDMIAAYDKLTDMGNTQWLRGIIQNLNESGGARPGLKHLRIYFDDGPCYEFVCRDFTVKRNQESGPSKA
jgi:hypothetical protein